MGTRARCLDTSRVTVDSALGGPRQALETNRKSRMRTPDSDRSGRHAPPHTRNFPCSRQEVSAQ